MNQVALATLFKLPARHPLLSRHDADLDFRQLRHQTKNALSRIMLQISEQLRTGADATRIAGELERRIMLTAQISDALFGFTHAPAPLPQRLEKLARGMLELLADPDQIIDLDVTVGTDIPNELDGLILRVAHEFIGNAIKHGLHMRLCGAIHIRVIHLLEEIVLEVSDDGWGPAVKTTPGEGLHIAHLLAAPHDGTVTLRKLSDVTLATLRVPVGGV